MDVMVWGSWSSCQMSQCSALHSWADRGAWGSGVGGSAGSSGVVQSWQIWGEVGRAVLGGQSGVTWSWPQRQHTQKGRLAMRLCVGRICGLWSIPMVKLVSGGGSVGTGMGSGIGCSG